MKTNQQNEVIGLGTKFLNLIAEYYSGFSVKIKENNYAVPNDQ